MKALMTYILLVIAALTAISHALTAQELLHAEMLGRPSATSINLSLMSAAAIKARILYGQDSLELDRSTPWQDLMPNEMSDINIVDLSSNTQYFYRVQLQTDRIIDRPVYRFHTQRPKGEAFTFVIQADPHMDEQSDTAMYIRALQNQLEDKPDFMLDLGDIVMSDKLKNASGKVTHDTITKRTRFMRSLYERTCHSVPLFIALGNHEGEAGWGLNATAENVPVWATLDRKAHLRNPRPDEFYTGDTTNHQFVGIRENYYAFEWGDALFIVLDPYWYTKPKPDSLNGWRWTLGKTQYDWVRTTLANSSARFKFVFAHQLVGGNPDGRGGIEYADLYEWGGKSLDGTESFSKNRPGWYKPLKDVFREHRVTAFFHGHDHFYAQQMKDCLIYQETPQPSHPSITNANSAKGYGYLNGLILPNSGHLRVSVSPEGVKVEYVRTYVPRQETGSRRNKDVSATYFIGAVNCYDSISTSVPVLYDARYIDDHVAPNPSTDVARINCKMPSDGTLTVTIRDISGRELRRLFDRVDVAAGDYVFIWDGRMANGTLVPSGNYIYEIDAGTIGRTTGTIVRTH